MKQAPPARGPGQRLPPAAGHDALAKSVQAAFHRALEHHQGGRLQDAESLYLQILQAMPRHADALHLLGVVALQRGDGAAAGDLIQRAIDIQPAANFYCNLGNALKDQGRRHEAIAAYRQALARDANLAEALCNLGNVLLDEGDADEAAACCRQAIALRPGFAEAHCNLGNALLKQGRLDDAIGCYRQTLQLRPGLAVAHSNLGSALAQQGQLDSAIAECRRAIQLQPRLAAAHSHLGDALCLKGLASDALDSYRQALAIGPETADLQRRMGRAFRQLGRLDLAIQSVVEALRRSEQDDTRAEFVQTIRSAHFTAPDAAVHGYLLRALDERWADAGDLLTPATSLVACDPAIAMAITFAHDQARAHAQAHAHAQASQMQAGSVGAAARLGPALLAGIAGDQLLRRLLQTDALNSIALERLLTLVRRQMLGSVTTEDYAVHPSSAALPEGDATAVLHGAIAQQCFINEYVYACSDAELHQLQQLRARLDACAADAVTPDPRWLVASAAYAPLWTLPGADTWAALDWPAPLAALFVQQCLEPATERACRSRIQRLTAIDDDVSRLVQAQYEDNPYPRWMQAPPATPPCSIDTLLRRQFPHAALQPLAATAALDVLVAGCGTGQHPIRVARQFPDARILAVDLSLSSLAYAQRQTDALGLDGHIRYAQADILHLGSIGKRFDLIESVGVLHHLADPLAGWRVLVDVLRPGGLMVLGLYSELGRRDVVAARSRLAAQGLAADAPDSRRRRQALMADDVAPAFEQFLSSRDFYSTSACRDLLFHVQEHRFTLPQLQAALAGLGLHFIGFELDTDVASAYALHFPDDPARTNLAHWHAFETARPDTFSRMYQFWVQKPG